MLLPSWDTEIALEELHFPVTKMFYDDLKTASSAKMGDAGLPCLCCNTWSYSYKYLLMSSAWNLQTIFAQVTFQPQHPCGGGRADGAICSFHLGRLIPYHWSCPWQSADLCILSSGLFLEHREDTRFSLGQETSLPEHTSFLFSLPRPSSTTIFLSFSLQKHLLFLISSFLFHIVT